MCLSSRARARRRRRARRRGTSSSRGRRQTRGARRTSVPQQACSSEQWRCCPRTSSTSRWSSSSATCPLRVGTGCRGRHAVASPSSSAAARRATESGELAGKLQAAYVLQDLEPEGAAERLDAPHRRSAAGARGSRRRRRALHRPLGARDGGVPARPGRAHWGHKRALPPAMHARPASRTSSWDGACPGPPLRSDARHRGARVAGRERASPGRDDWLRASRGVALAMLGRFEEGACDPRRQPEPSWQSAAAALQLAVLTAIESAIIERLAGDPATAAAFGAEGCRLLEELEAQSFLSTAAAFSPGRSTSSAGSTRLTRGPRRAARGRRPRRSVHTAPLAAGTREDPRAAGRARQTRSVSPEKRSAITESTQDLNGLGDAYADSRGGASASQREPDEAAAALEQALERYERKENLASAERTRARLEELCGVRPSPSSRPAPRPRAPSGRSRPAG